MSEGLVVQLRPAGDGPPLRDRLADAARVIAGDAKLVFVGVIVAVVPVTDDRPDATKWRLALKKLRRQAGLAASWDAKAGRPERRPVRKAKGRQRASHGRERAAGEGGP